MDFYKRFFLNVFFFNLMGLSLYNIGSLSLYAQQSITAEEFQKTRNAAIQNFEAHEQMLNFRNHLGSESSISSQKSDGEEPTKNHKYRFSPNAVSSQATQQAELAETTLSEPEENPDHSSPLTPSYYRRLKRALPCFKEFVASLYKARSQRDMRLTDCARENCDFDKPTRKFEKASLTITDQFYVCIDTEMPDTNKTALKN